MNKAINRIKRAIWADLPDSMKKDVVILDTDSDEEKVAKLLSLYGSEWETTREKHGKFCRWDVEGYTHDGKRARIEIKSRTYGKDFDTWIIDTYKIDYMLEKFSEDTNYFVNVFEGEYHVYCAEYVATCEVVKRKARFKDGSSALRTFYVIPKNDHIVELGSGTKGDKYNKVWKKKKQNGKI